MKVLLEVPGFLLSGSFGRHSSVRSTQEAAAEISYLLPRCKVHLEREPSIKTPSQSSAGTELTCLGL